MRKHEAHRQRVGQAEFAHDRHEIVAVGAEPVQQDHRGHGRNLWRQRDVEVGLVLPVVHARNDTPPGHAGERAHDRALEAEYLGVLEKMRMARESLPAARQDESAEAAVDDGRWREIMASPATRRADRQPWSPVRGFVRQYPTHSTARVFAITLVPRDQVNVQVRHCLPSGGAVIDADVVARGMELTFEMVAGRDQQRHQVGALCVGDFKERRHVSPGDDQRLAGRDREAVADDDRVLALQDEAFGGEGAEGAGGTQLRFHGVGDQLATLAAQRRSGDSADYRLQRRRVTAGLTLYPASAG